VDVKAIQLEIQKEIQTQTDLIAKAQVRIDQLHAAAENIARFAGDNHNVVSADPVVKEKVSSSSSYWSRLTPEERRVEMRRRQAVRKRNAKKQALVLPKSA